MGDAEKPYHYHYDRASDAYYRWEWARGVSELRVWSRRSDAQDWVRADVELMPMAVCAEIAKTGK